MTVGELIELVYLKVNGDNPSPDSTIMRADIRTYLPAAINYAMDKAYNLNRQTEDDRDYPSEFYTVFNDLSISRTARLPSFTLTVGTVPLKGGMGIRFVYDNCGTQYAPVSDADMGNIEYYSKLTPGMGWYRETGGKIVLYGVNPLAETINCQVIVKIEDLGDDDVAPLQAGSENDVLSLMIKWFATRFPYNALANARDVNAADV
jgi:hypothetical protein